MIISFDDLLIIIFILFCLDSLLLVFVISNKTKEEDKVEKKRKANRDFMLSLFNKLVLQRRSLMCLNYTEMKQSLLLGEREEWFYNSIAREEFEKKYIRRLKSIFKTTRIEAAVYLGIIGTEKSRKALEEAICKEKNCSVKLLMANALTDIGDEKSIPVLIVTLYLSNSPRWYRAKVNMLLADFGESFNKIVPALVDKEENEIKELLVSFASVHISEEMKKYLIRIIDQYHKEDKNLVYEAAEILGKYYYNEIKNEKYLYHEDIKIRIISLKALANINTEENITALLKLLGEQGNPEDDAVKRTAINSVSRLIEKNPHYLSVVVRAFYSNSEKLVRSRLAEILSLRIEYFIMKLNGSERKQAAEIIREIILLGKTSAIIDFLNRNKDIDLENEVIAIIKDIIKSSQAIEKEFCVYLNERIQNKCGLLHCQLLLAESGIKEKGSIKILATSMVAVFMLFPLIYCLRYYDSLFILSWEQQLKIFVVDFNYYLAFYSIAINTIYLIILGFSYAGAKRTKILWDVKKVSLLFKRGMLPSISVIAPAFNEEKTVIESVNSLLNLKYPEYELIIVNDGSTDSTLSTLINYYGLIRVDYIFETRLNSMPIRGVYINRNIPKLIVVDKVNGGKADSLNTGINISQKEYICCIDADSLLEQDALLKLASMTLDEESETPALGGNILPVNGCSVQRGVVSDIKVPANKLVRFQTVEYIRAFLAGRIGWSQLNSLLIISGAFGLFKKQRVIEVGGYLTNLEKYRKDTVGEDMELVVRISRLLREEKKKFIIRYSALANCWTQVPEDIKSLKRQRERWHRGLLEIITFHKKTIFNPSYGRMGLVAMPYFYIFEAIGPLIEVQGYIMVAAAIILGLFNLEIALFLFMAVILLGIMVSLSSLLLSVKLLNIYRSRDLFVLTISSVLENFGYRQLVSLWRVVGSFKALKQQDGWGKADRKDFTEIQIKSSNLRQAG